LVLNASSMITLLPPGLQVKASTMRWSCCMPCLGWLAPDASYHRCPITLGQRPAQMALRQAALTPKMAAAAPPAATLPLVHWPPHRCLRAAALQRCWSRQPALQLQRKLHGHRPAAFACGGTLLAVVQAAAPAAAVAEGLRRQRRLCCCSMACARGQKASWKVRSVFWPLLLWAHGSATLGLAR
jgi:hypothetical protein